MNSHDENCVVVGAGEGAKLTAPVPSPRTLILVRKGAEHVVMFDDCDSPIVDPHTWHIVLSPNSTTPYAARGKDNRTMHREILGLERGDPRQGDHVDGNGLNNTRGNLRIATPFEQSWNKRAHRDTESGYKGVRRHGRGWRARIIANGVLLLIGVYPTKEEAARAYNEKALELHGEFARLNIIPEDAA